MFLDETPKGSNIRITVKNTSGASAVFYTKSIGTLNAFQKHPLVVQAIRRDDKLVNFSGFSVVAEVMFAGDSRICKYIISGIATTKINNVTCHVLYSNDNVSPKDRRNAVRVELQTPANIKINEAAPIIVETYDLSMSGISFIAPGNVVVRPESKIEGTFIFKDLGTSYSVVATVMRADKRPDGKVLIGCQFDNFNKGIVALVTHLARKQGKGIVQS